MGGQLNTKGILGVTGWGGGDFWEKREGIGVEG